LHETTDAGRETMTEIICASALDALKTMPDYCRLAEKRIAQTLEQKEIP